MTFLILIGIVIALTIVINIVSFIISLFTKGGSKSGGEITLEYAGKDENGKDKFDIIKNNGEIIGTRTPEPRASTGKYNWEEDKYVPGYGPGLRWGDFL